MKGSVRSRWLSLSLRVGALLGCSPCVLACGAAGGTLPSPASAPLPRSAEAAPSSAAAAAANTSEVQPKFDFTVMDKWHLCEIDDLDDCRLQCRRGHLPSCVRLGNIYAGGTRVPRDLATAADLYELPCTYHIAAACSNRASIFAHDHEFAHAVEYYARGCESGDPGGCFELGFLYDAGRGVTRNGSRAAQLYQKACDGGDLPACSNLGRLYMLADGVERDDVRAVLLFQRACHGGNAGGCGNLGSAYQVGRGVPRDPARAIELHKRACDGGEKDFCGLLASASSITTVAK